MDEGPASTRLRWRLASDAGPQQALFDDDPPTWRAGHGEFRGLEFLEVRAQRVINPVPPQSRMSFRYTINAYRGCSHACSYCSGGDTPILMADGRTRALADLRVGDRIYGTEEQGRYRRYVITTVLDRWSVVKLAYRTVLEDGTELITSADHRFLSDRGWKRVARTSCDRHGRAHLLAEAAQRTRVQTAFSVGTVDDEVWKLSEPGTPHPRRRLEALVRLREAGISTGVLAAPILPGTSDSPSQLEALAKALVEAGVESASPIVLHLRPGVKQEYVSWLANVRPDLLARYDEIYGRRAYAPKAIQEEINARFHAAFDAIRSRSRCCGAMPRTNATSSWKE